MMKLYYNKNNANEGWVDCYKIRIAGNHFICTDYDGDDIVVEISGEEAIVDEYYDDVRGVDYE